MSAQRFGLRLARLFYLGDWLGSLLVFGLAVLAYNWGLRPWPPTADVPLVLACIAAIWGTLPLLLEIYRQVSDKRVLSSIYRVLWFEFIAAFCLAGALYIFNIDTPRLMVGYFVVLDAFWLVVLRVLVYGGLRWWSTGNPKVLAPSRVLIAGCGPIGIKAANDLRQQHVNVQVVGFLDDDTSKHGLIFAGAPVLGGLDRLAATVSTHQVSELLVALPWRAYERMVNLVGTAQRLPLNIKVIPDLFALALVQASAGNFASIPVIDLRPPVIVGSARIVKRLFDIAVSAMLLLLLSPIMAVIALAVKLDSHGPVFYKQDRVGENGQIFKMWKFRSMCIDADKRLKEVIRHTSEGMSFKRADDPRVTPVGKVIRAWSLDELPQLINVLLGDMSLVGPRPEMPWMLEQYQAWQLARFSVPQGITGWWQVTGRSDKPMHLNTDADLYYIRNYSLWLDFQILFRTLEAVLRRRGAY